MDVSSDEHTEMDVSSDEHTEMDVSSDDHTENQRLTARQSRRKLYHRSNSSFNDIAYISLFCSYCAHTKVQGLNALIGQMLPDLSKNNLSGISQELQQNSYSNKHQETGMRNCVYLLSKSPELISHTIMAFIILKYEVVVVKDEVEGIKSCKLRCTL